jgi:anti-anti-sigma factor
MQSLQRARPERVCANVRRIVSLTDNPPVLRCCGDEDRSTQSLRRPALSRALAVDDDLVVDLSDLAFADASLMVDLAMVARRLRKSGRQMRMRGASPTIHTLIEMVGLHRLQGVHVEIAPAPAAG